MIQKTTTYTETNQLAGPKLNENKNSKKNMNLQKK